jgi:dTDP-4-dehydrorhamnose 3,5-epimerase
MIEGVLLTHLKIIDLKEGDILRVIKSIDPGYESFGEAYFSTTRSGMIKAWKKHKKMTLNLVVPTGELNFVMYDDRQTSSTLGDFQIVNLSRENYFRLTVPPGIWFGFKAQGKEDAMMLNISNMIHDESEIERKSIENITFDWSFK